MKFAAIATLSTFAVFALMGCGGGPLQVGDVFDNPLEYQQPFELTATVTQISPDHPATFAIVDNVYILGCGYLNCGTTRMLANNVGGSPMPVPGDVVDMTGRFEYVGAMWVFMADSITVEDNVMHRLFTQPAE
ncbi:MAG: hypothetical protein FWC81_01820 [Coriobacteriia bacterium]|nr:hypothetical protein [Coriobacteriia bacterium]MCL2605790.1 hypothetical protein [Coriobacteriia bacterium]